MRLYKLLPFILALLFGVTACLPPPKVPAPQQPNNNLGTAKWGTMKYEEKK